MEEKIRELDLDGCEINARNTIISELRFLQIMHYYR